MEIVVNLPDNKYQVMLTKIMLDCPGCKIIEITKGHGKLIDVDKIEYQQGCFIDSEGNPIPILHKIATIEMLRDWAPEVVPADRGDAE